jgi:hypothetical protein
MPQHFTSKKVLRWVEHGVKVEFKKGLPFAPKHSDPKFIDPQDVDFAIKDLLKGRRIGTYQDLAPGGEQFLSRSRVHTPPGKGKQRIVHALYIHNEVTVNRQTIYEGLHMHKSVVKSQEFMLSLDVESAFFHVPIHPKHRKFFSSHLELSLFVNKFIELHPGGYFVCSGPYLVTSMPSTQTPLHLRHHYHQVVEFSHAALPLGWTSSTRIWTIVVSVVTVALHRHGIHTLLYVDDLLITCSSFEKFKGTTNNRGYAPHHGHSPRATQGILRFSDPDPVRPFGLHHLLHWERSPTGPREEMLRVMSSNARTAVRGN